MRAITVTAFVAIGCAVFVVGCQSVEHQLGMDVNPKYTELRQEQPGDLPVPDGFTLETRPRQTYSVDLGNGGFRNAHLVYVGKTPPRKVARFYERNMVRPPFGWRNESRYQTEGDRNLKFIKGDALKGHTYCAIVITRIQVGEDLKTKIEVDLVSKP